MAYAVVDFETQGVDNRPDYPPIPCGLAIKVGSSRKYYAWGHASGNNGPKCDAVRALRKVWDTHELIFHNAAFDIEVAMHHFRIKKWPRRFHDTLVLAYLHDPREPSLALKDLADSYLDMPPEEQDELKDWITKHVPAARKKKSIWGRFIQRAPGDLVGRYAIGDVERTWRLFKTFMPYIKDPVEGDSMIPAYERELRLLKTKISMEKRGIRGDTVKLQRDIPHFQAFLGDLDKTIRRKLKVGKRWEAKNCPNGVFNPASGMQLAKALDHAGLVAEDEWLRTPTGKRSTSRESLEHVIKDSSLITTLSLHSITRKYLSTFLLPWLESCEANDGFIYPTFNTTRRTDEYGADKGYGARTGRLSSSNPNFQNIPASVEGSVHEGILTIMQNRLKKYDVELVGLRDYLIPDEGCVFLNRDYSQQEFRILAHYEDGGLMDRYNADPKIDAHTLVQQMVYEATGKLYPRKAIKNINFGIIYGMGAKLLSLRAGCSVEEARSLKKTILRQVPGIGHLDKDLKKLARRDLPLRTFGGRYYYCEEPAIVGGKRRTFEYKMLNLLIQGSAADCTKMAMIQVEDALCTGQLVLQVHDELHVVCPARDAEREMKLMKEAMEDMHFDVPMLTDGKWGLHGESWARMVKCPF